MSTMLARTAASRAACAWGLALVLLTCPFMAAVEAGVQATSCHQPTDTEPTRDSQMGACCDEQPAVQAVRTACGPLDSRLLDPSEHPASWHLTQLAEATRWTTAPPDPSASAQPPLLYLRHSSFLI